MATPKKPPTDWEAIERAYRATGASVNAIAKAHGVSHTAVNKRITEYGWKRDLTDDVNRETKRKVIEAAVSTQVSTETKVSDHVIVDQASQVQFHVIQSQQRRIDMLLQLVDAQSNELVSTMINLDDINAQISASVPGDENGDRARRQRMESAVLLPARSSILQNLVNSAQKLVQLQRQAYSIPDEIKPQSTDPIEMLLKEIDGQTAGLPQLGHDVTNDTPGLDQ